MKSEKVMEQVEQAAKILRNCRKIEHRMHQLEKQLYLGHTSAYNILMEILHPNYKEHREKMRNKHQHRPQRSPKERLEGPLSDNPILNKLEKELADGKK